MSGLILRCNVYQLLDAVLSLLDKPLSLLGKVNGFIKPEDAGTEAGVSCDGEGQECGPVAPEETQVADVHRCVCVWD